MKSVWNFITNTERLRQYTASFSAMLITICSGLHFGWTSPYMPILLSEDSPVPMTNEESSWVAVIYLIAGPFSAVLIGLILNVFGRKPILIASALLFLASWLIIAFANSLPQLLVARFIAGFVDGSIFGALTVYLAEIVEKDIRGFVCSFITIFFIFGVLLINIMGAYLSIYHSSLVIATLPIVFLAIFVWMPESPNYFLMKGEVEKAKKCLRMLRSDSQVDEELDDILKSVQEDASVKFIDLFTSKVHRKNLLVVMGLRGGQQLSGVVAFVFYAQTVFQEAGDIVSPLMSAVILYSLQIVFSTGSAIFVDKLGRRPLLIVSISVMAVALLVEGTFFYMRDKNYLQEELQWIPISALVVFMIAFSLGMQIIPLFIVGEIFPTNIRPHAAAFSDVFYFLFAFVASKFFQVTKDAYGLYVSFFTFAGCTVVGLIVIILFVPETKNKTLHEIQLELKNIN